MDLKNNDFFTQDGEIFEADINKKKNFNDSRDYSIMNILSTITENKNPFNNSVTKIEKIKNKEKQDGSSAVSPKFPNNNWKENSILNNNTGSTLNINTNLHNLVLNLKPNDLITPKNLHTNKFLLLGSAKDSSKIFL